MPSNVTLLPPAATFSRGHQVNITNGPMPDGRRISCFDASLMPINSIRQRELFAFSVHYSVSTSKWIATVERPAEDKRRCVSFSFATEDEARKFAKAYSPPKMMTNASQCVCCSIPFTAKCGSHNCRNCGSQICEECSARWGIRMLPKTFLRNPNAALTVRVCKSCDWLSNAFCMALLRGSHADAIRFHATGNVNVRCTFADISKEAMFPIHCAVMGGNVEVVKWLVDKLGCPMSVRRDPKTGLFLSVQTSAGRTLVDLAMTGKPKVAILRYLVQKRLSMFDTKDPTLAPKTLQTLMGAGFQFEQGERETVPLQLVDSSDHVSIATTLEDACIICCEKPMDCVLTPCGHQMCCSDCGSRLKACPICKKESSFLKIYRL